MSNPEFQQVSNNEQIASMLRNVADAIQRTPTLLNVRGRPWVSMSSHLDIADHPHMKFRNVQFDLTYQQDAFITHTMQTEPDVFSLHGRCKIVGPKDEVAAIVKLLPDIDDEEKGEEPGDSQQALFDAYQRIENAVVSLPTFEVRHEGGIEAATQNIVDAIETLARMACGINKEADLIARGPAYEDAERMMREAVAQAGIEWGDVHKESRAYNVLLRAVTIAHKAGFTQARDRLIDKKQEG